MNMITIWVNNEQLEELIAGNFTTTCTSSMQIQVDATIEELTEFINENAPAAISDWGVDEE